MSAAEDFREEIGIRKFATVLADPPWRFQNKTGKVAPRAQNGLRAIQRSHLRKLRTYLSGDVVEETAHLYLWVPNALLAEGLQVMKTLGISIQKRI